MNYGSTFLTYILALSTALLPITFSTASSLDIGSPDPPGSSTELSPGTWQVNASGYDIWSSSDSFHYYNFERNSDVTITAFIENWETNHDWAKGGLMIRDGLDASSANVALFSSGGNYVMHQYRRWNGDSTRSYHELVGTKRVWLRLVKEGAKITSYMKLESDVNWIKFYERSDVVFGGDSFYVGVAATSHRQGELASLTVRGFEILNKIWVPVPPPHLDIGRPATSGNAMNTAPGKWTVMGAGNDIWSSWDQFHFVQLNRTSDGTVTCFVEGFQEDYDWAKGGLMIRDTLDQNSPYVGVFMTGHSYGNIATQTRPTAGSYTTGVSERLYTNVQRAWLRLVKEGTKVTSYYKNEGELVYQKLESYSVDWTRSWYYLGIAVTSHEADMLATLEVSNFTISDEIFTLPARDIGDTGREIVANKLNEEMWSIEGSGWDIGGTADSFAFNNYKQTAENLTATVHLDRLRTRNLNSKGGIMLRSSHDPDSPHVSLLTAKAGITMFYRTASGGGTSKKNVGVWSEHMELKLEKQGSSVACMYKHKSFDDWFYLDSVAIDIGSEYYVGHAVTSADYGYEATLVAGNIHVNGEELTV